jgi:hypothetical protein
VLDQSHDAAISSNQLKHSPRSTTPPLSSYPVAAKEAYTPERGSHLSINRQSAFLTAFLNNTMMDLRCRLVPEAPSTGFQDTAAAGSPPTLSSSAYFDEGQSSSLRTETPESKACTSQYRTFAFYVHAN